MFNSHKENNITNILLSNIYCCGDKEKDKQPKSATDFALWY